MLAPRSYYDAHGRRILDPLVGDRRASWALVGSGGTSYYALSLRVYVYGLSGFRV